MQTEINRPRSSAPMTTENLIEQLGPTATLEEVVGALVEAGIRVEDLAALTGRTESSVHKWIQGKQQPGKAECRSMSFGRSCSQCCSRALSPVGSRAGSVRVNLRLNLSPVYVL